MSNDKGVWRLGGLFVAVADISDEGMKVLSEAIRHAPALQSISLHLRRADGDVPNA